VDALFEKTLLDHPDWWCRRSPGKRARPKQWKTFFIEFPYRDINELNKEWKEDKDGRFRKRRKLTWVEVSDLLAIYENKPKKLWKRVRQLEYAPNVIRAIQRIRMQ
ncbi:MAG: hypothetical protein KZQ92_03405, partial [Candidatus Thiodiazotropha sp. (ex Lucinoma borealis)]|nr:hypothetical protein [Candidatus Thiodiazotropha sp. (ex Lucinoma borealis)]